MRDFQMLYRVIVGLHREHPELRFHLVVDGHARQQDGLVQLQNHPAVQWYEKISDEQLKQLYQHSYLLVLPMENSGANNAVVEALSCGLPIVTTDVGGIRDYGGGLLFPVIPAGDDKSMIALVKRYLVEQAWHTNVSMACRNFALEHLSWPMIAQQHVDFYKKLA
jgi:glycosyltransferase involved in cell wall biosynthesis